MSDCEGTWGEQEWVYDWAKSHNIDLPHAAMVELRDHLTSLRPDTAPDLTQLMKADGTDIHGSCHIVYDGDCFKPPPWKCVLRWWQGEAVGKGDTPHAALAAARIRKEAEKNAHTRDSTLHEIAELLECLSTTEVRKIAKKIEKEAREARVNTNTPESDSGSDD